MEELLLVGLNHTTAPVSVREKFSGNKRDCEQLLTLLRFDVAAGEAVVLATCNRFEVYAANVAAEKVLELLAEHGAMAQAELTPYLYFKTSRDVARHLFRVSAGLDSIVLGEDQILGQVADALQLAQAQRSSGRVLNTLFQHAVASGKRVRNETALGEGSFSVGRAAVDLAREKLESLADKTVLVLGAGKISELSAKHLVSNGTRPILVANRTHAHAQNLAERIGGEAVHFEELHAILPTVDIVLSSTSAPHYVLHASLVAEAMLKRPDRPMLLIDMAVPRDIEPSVSALANVSLYNVDDLKSVQAESFERRRCEIPRAEALLEETFDRFRIQTAGLQASSVIQALHGKLDGIRQAELNRIAHVLETLTPDQRAAVTRLTETITNKFLHEPTVQLKEIHLREKSILTLVCDLFRLPTSPASCGAKRAKQSSCNTLSEVN